jgi:ethanolamine utilization protein EutL
LIPLVHGNLANQLKLTAKQRSIGLISADNDDATYVAIDEATKMADVEVVYARSFYAGAKHTSGLLSGEIMAILAGPDPAEVQAGLNAALNYMKNEAIWYSANEDASIAFFPHVISRTGTYLSKMCNLPAGSPIAYLIAPPNEGLVALDAALTGDQSACKAAAVAFQNKVLEVASQPFNY